MIKIALMLKATVIVLANTEVLHICNLKYSIPNEYETSVLFDND